MFGVLTWFSMVDAMYQDTPGAMSFRISEEQIRISPIRNDFNAPVKLKDFITFPDLDGFTSSFRPEAFFHAALYNRLPEVGGIVQVGTYVRNAPYFPEPKRRNLLLVLDHLTPYAETPLVFNIFEIGSVICLKEPEDYLQIEFEQ